MIKININGESGKKYRVQKTRLWEKLLTDHEVRLNTFCFTLFVISACVVLVFALHSFIHRVYSKPTAYVNSAGAIVNMINNKEIALWLYNPSQIMANSGIRVSAGDKIKISASGAYHSGIHSAVDAIVYDSINHPKDTTFIYGIVYAANENVPPTYKWVPQYNQGTDKWYKTFCRECKSYCNKIYSFLKNDTTLEPHEIDPNVEYGTLLVGVMDEFENPLKEGSDSLDFTTILDDSTTILDKLEPAYNYRNKTAVERSGVLHFIINDSRHLQSYYSDNLGETLVCIEIEHAHKNMWILCIALIIMIISGLYPFMRIHVKSKQFQHALQVTHNLWKKNKR